MKCPPTPSLKASELIGTPIAALTPHRDASGVSFRDAERSFINAGVDPFDDFAVRDAQGKWSPATYEQATQRFAAWASEQGLSKEQILERSTVAGLHASSLKR